MENNSVKIIRIIKAPIDKVWDAWTNEESLKNWKSPEGMTTPSVEIDLKVGGKYRITMEGSDMPDPSHNGIVTVGGEYIEIEKPNKLVYTWHWEHSKNDPITKVTVLLKELDEESTEVTLIHSGFENNELQKEHDMGWNSTLNKLERFLVQNL